MSGGFVDQDQYSPLVLQTTFTRTGQRQHIVHDSSISRPSFFESVITAMWNEMSADAVKYEFTA